MDPFAPIPRTPAPSGGSAVCPGCGNGYDPATGTIDGTGRMVCRTCAAGAQSAAASKVMVAHDPTTARNLWGGATVSALSGFLTCCTSSLGVFFVFFTLVPISSGAGVLWVLATQPKARETLGPMTFAVALLATTGIGFGLLGLVVSVLVFTGALARP